MGRNSVESIIEDFVKGAREGGFKGNIVVSRDNFGHEEKLASNYAGIGGALAGPVGAALGAEDGSGWRAAGGNLAGGIGGGLGGALLARLLHASPEAMALASAGGALGGGVLGAHLGGAKKEKLSSLAEATTTGYANALKKLGFLGSMIGPLAGVLAGPAARAAMPALGKRVGTGLGGMAFDAVAGQAANSAIDRMRGPRQ